MIIKANGISMNYELSGSGRYFTLIHGAGDNLNAWYNQVPVFSRRYHVLTYDVRGHGQTELPEEGLTTKLWVEDLYALLKALNISETILLGFSMGAGIAQAFTLAHPQIVKALILSNGGGLGRRSEEGMREMASRRQTQIEDIKKRGIEAVVEQRTKGPFTPFSPGFVEKSPETIKQYKEMLRQNNPEGYLRVMQRMGQPTTPPDLSKITCPTLIIAGEHDATGGTAGAKATQEAIHGSQLKVFPTGHATAIEQPKAYNETILRFLAEVGLG